MRCPACRGTSDRLHRNAQASRATGALPATLAAEIAAFQRLRYSGYDYDPWSETYYLQARYYDPATKQFLSKDPAEADGEESAYQYCAGDPVNQDDPDGEFAQVLWGAVGGAAFYAGEQAVAGAWKARSVFKKHGFKAGMRATWQNTKKSWSWKAFRGSVAIGAATGGLGMAAKSGKLAAVGAKAATGARAGRCRVLSSGAKAANRVSRGRVPAKTFCFVAGTLVLTAQGPVPIEAVQLGDMVLSRESATGEQGLREVTELYRNQTSELVHVDIGDETITVTPEHPFWVEGTGWVEAGKLAAGDKVARAEGDPATIVSVTRERLQSPQDVYNFEVAEFHTYFVASAGVWVHNACAAKVSVKGASRGQHRYYANKELYKRVTESAKYAKKMRNKYGDDAIEEFIANKGRRNVRGTQWHHNVQETANPLRRRVTMTAMKRGEHRAWHQAKGRAGGFKQGQLKGWW